MTSVEEVRKEAKYKGITLSCQSKRERIVVLQNGRMVAVNKVLYDSLNVSVRKI